MKMRTCKFAQDEVPQQQQGVGSKKHAPSLPEGSDQQGQSQERKKGKGMGKRGRLCGYDPLDFSLLRRRPLAAFFNRPAFVRSSSSRVMSFSRRRNVLPPFPMRLIRYWARLNRKAILHETPIVRFQRTRTLRSGVLSWAIYIPMTERPHHHET
jgi:hypothetical protein